MKILVTGAAGFIGQYVLRELSKYDSNEIIAIHRSTSNELKKFKNVKYVRKDISQINKEFFYDIGNPEILIHLSWGNLPNYDSDYHTKIEFPIQLNFLKQFIECGPKNVMISGTCFEYGKVTGCIKETNNLNPLNLYAKAKVMLLNNLIKLKNKKNFHLTWARLFYMYGDGQNPKSLWPQIKKSVEINQSSFDIAGGQLRDYLHVNNVAKYLVSLSMLEKDIGAINVCSGVPISIEELVEGWKKKFNWKIKINLGAFHSNPNESISFWGDNKKLLDLLE